MGKHTPNVGIDYTRNPDYYLNPIPYIEKLSRIIFADSSAQESAFITSQNRTAGIGG